MKRKTKTFLIVLSVIVIIFNYWIYVERIKYEYWEIEDLLVFLGIVNMAIVSLPTMIYISINESIEMEENNKLANLLLQEMVERHRNEVEHLKSEVQYYKELDSKNKKPKSKKKKIVKNEV